MEKYQNALNTIIYRLTSYEDDLELRETDKLVINTLQELINKKEEEAKEYAIDILWMVIKNLEQMYSEMKARSDSRKVKSLYNQLMRLIEQLEKEV